MTYWEWVLVYRKLAEYGYAPPLLDVGGVLNTAMIDAENLSGTASHIIRPRSGRIWDGIDRVCDVTHDVEAYASNPNLVGKYLTILSTSTLEHAANPFRFMGAIKTLLGIGGLATIVTVFAWSEHGDYDKDNWRFTRHGLEVLVRDAGLTCLEVGKYELNPCRQHAYVICSNGKLSSKRRHDIVVPEVTPEVNYRNAWEMCGVNA